MRFLCILLLGCFTSAAPANEIKVPLIGLGWQITFQAPDLRESSLEYPQGTIQFRANAGRFNVSVFVEPPPAGVSAGTHATCRDYHWSQAKRNPLIVADSIKQTTLRNCESVVYRAKGVHQGIPFVQDSVNCYFVHEGKWVDVHASVIEPTAEDSQSLADFATHLKYGPWEGAKGEPEKIALGKLGTLGFTPPAGWLTGNLTRNDSIPGTPRYSITFQSPEDPNSICIMTTSPHSDWPESAGAVREELRTLLQSSTSGLSGTYVEKQPVIRDLGMKHGTGVTTTLTDANLVGKPVEVGNIKTITTSFIAPKRNAFIVVSIFADNPDGEDAKKMLKTVESLVLD